MEQEPTKEFPDTLDVMNIDGRLAQLATFRTIKWVDSGENEYFDYDIYETKRGWEEGIVTIGDYFKKHPEEETLLPKIHWSENDTPYLKKQVRFFGWLTSKKK